MMFVYNKWEKYINLLCEKRYWTDQIERENCENKILKTLKLLRYFSLCIAILSCSKIGQLIPFIPTSSCTNIAQSVSPTNSTMERNATIL